MHFTEDTSRQFSHDFCDSQDKLPIVHVAGNHEKNSVLMLGRETSKR